MKDGDTIYMMYQYFFWSLDMLQNRVSLSEQKLTEIQKNNMDHIGAMAQKDKFYIARPYGGDGDSSGILIMICAELK